MSQGVPRLINVICDRALLGAYSNEIRRVNRRTIRRAAAEITGKAQTANWLRWAVPVFGAAAAGVIAMAFLSLLDERRELIDDAIDSPIASAAAAQAKPQPVADVAEVTEPTVEESLDARLRLAADLTGTESALATLMRLWGIDHQSGAQACTQAAAAGYECLFQRGSWSGLKRYDRPAVLTLVDSKGAAHSIVLTAIEGETLDLSIGGVTVTHLLDEVSDMWFGQYLLLWRPPNGSPAALGPGSRGANVVWLRQSLAAIDARYQTANTNSDVFDDELQEQVRVFQRDHRIDVDGLAGHQTQIIINTLLAPDDTPRLTIPRLAQE